DNQIIQELGIKNASTGITPSRIICLKSVVSKRKDLKKIAEKYPNVMKDEEIYSLSTSNRLVIKEIQ
ncbi:endonuclease, partial [Enterococcus hirae]